MSTEAGRSLAAWTFGVAFVANPDVAESLRANAEKQIAAIEAEARAAVLAELLPLLTDGGEWAHEFHYPNDARRTHMADCRGCRLLTVVRAAR